MRYCLCDYNNTFILMFMSLWTYFRNVRSPTTYVATNFLVSLITNILYNVNIIKNSLYDGSLVYILIGNPQ